MRKICVVFIALLLIALKSNAQGKIVLVGGGSEEEGGWSDLPYRWAVEQSSNKKVAVISYSPETDFIPNYFKSLGAEEADNIRINSRSQADELLMYDSLMKYDVFFFKGGDQSYYYKYFRNTRTAQAIADKFAQGGVMSGTSAGMAILSGVVFTAEKSSVYPDEAMTDFKSGNITLANDLTPLLPGFIADSHFTERGRVGRMFAFLANWHFKTGEWISGIGVDDRTALCLDASDQGFVFGTGSVSFYSTNSIEAHQDEKPVADSIAAIQLLHGHSIQLPNLAIIDGPVKSLEPINERKTGTYTILLSGSESLDSNKDFLNTFVNHGAADDSVVVITRSSGAKPFIAELVSRGVKHLVVETKAENNDDAHFELRNKIRTSKKILFVDNDDASIFSFLNGGKTGSLIRSHLFRNGILTGFVGQDSRYAGKVFVTNHLAGPYHAYYGDLIFSKGFGLLRSSVVMPDTWTANTTDFYENTTASVTYAMVSDTLRYGIYLNRNTWLKFAEEAMTNYFESNGDYSTVILVNNGTQVQSASQPVNTQGDVRDYVGFVSMKYVLLNGARKLSAGLTVSSTDPNYEYEMVVTGLERPLDDEMKLYPNPSTGIFNIVSSKSLAVTITVVDRLGRMVWNGVLPPAQNLNLSFLSNGLYHVKLSAGGALFKRSVVIQK
jgi:cyanophycinase